MEAWLAVVGTFPDRSMMDSVVPYRVVAPVVSHRALGDTRRELQA